MVTPALLELTVAATTAGEPSEPSSLMLFMSINVALALFVVIRHHRFMRPRLDDKPGEPPT